MERHLVIAGPMGVGKSTLAEALGTRLRWPVRDSDRDIEALTGRTGRAIAAADGVDALHRLEAAVLLGALADTSSSVVAAAGWIIEDPVCRRALARRSRVVVLDLPVDRIVARAASGDHRRPIDPQEVAALRDRRMSWYREAADVWLSAESEPAALATEVIEALGLAATDR